VLNSRKPLHRRVLFNPKTHFAPDVVVRQADLPRGCAARKSRPQNERGNGHSSQAGRGSQREILMQNVYTLSDFSNARRKTARQETSDEALLTLIAKDDKSAMQEFFVRHNVRVYRFIAHLTGNATLAEDIVSEVFLNVWRRADQFGGRSQVSTWLLAIARYKALNALRRNWELPLNGETAASIVDTADDPETNVHHMNRREIVQKCLTQLSPAHREIIDLVYYHENSIAEVAQIVGVPIGTVKTRMFYARKYLAELLKVAGIRGVRAS
jgi:RNA polymerase sigma-70 factor, ECF subfamily